MLKIAYYEIIKLLRDKRSLLLVLLQPVLMVILMGLATLNNPKDIRVAVFSKSDNQYSKEVLKDLQNEKDLKIDMIDSEVKLRDQIGKDLYRGGIIVNIKKDDGQIGGNIQFIDNSTVPEISNQAKLLAINSAKETLTNFAKENIQEVINNQTEIQSQTIKKDTNQKLTEFKASLAKLSLPQEQLSALNSSIDQISNINLTGFENLGLSDRQVSIIETKNTTKTIRYFDFYASAVVMLLVLLTCINMSSSSITQERVDGTFERFFVTPFTRTKMVMGKMLTFSITSLMIAFLTIGSLHFLFNAAIGEFWLVMLITYLTSLSAVAIGLLVSSFTKTVAESIQVSITIFFASLILTQFIFQVETMHPMLAKITWFIPFTYSMRALREVNLLNVGFMDVWQDIAILAGSVVLFICLAILSLRRKAS